MCDVVVMATFDACMCAYLHLYVQLCPENTEEFIDYLKSIGRLDEAAVKLSEIVNKVQERKRAPKD